MRPTRALLLGLIGLLISVALAMGALALVRGGRDEPSDVEEFPALVPSISASLSPAPTVTATASPTDDDQPSSPTSAVSPTATRTGDDARDGDGDREGPGDDD